MQAKQDYGRPPGPRIQFSTTSAEQVKQLSTTLRRNLIHYANLRLLQLNISYQRSRLLRTMPSEWNATLEKAPAHLPTRRAQNDPNPAFRTGGRNLGFQVHSGSVPVCPVQSISHASSSPIPTAPFVVDLFLLCSQSTYALLLCRLLSRPSLF